jgi:hypothetical protein
VIVRWYALLVLGLVGCSPEWDVAADDQAQTIELPADGYDHTWMVTITPSADATPPGDWADDPPGAATFDARWSDTAPSAVTADVTFGASGDMGTAVTLDGATTSASLTYPFAAEGPTTLYARVVSTGGEVASMSLVFGAHLTVVGGEIDAPAPDDATIELVVEDVDTGIDTDTTSDTDTTAE